ncbi:MAG: alpha-N-acetylglucosaminidase [Bacteroidales bacterium]|nr:alpha-N-acetylglucosaminidase [Bacteroidales bacterium]
MKKTILTMAFILSLALLSGQSRPIDGLATRILGDKSTKFEFVYQSDTADYFVLSQHGDKVRIVGNNDNSLAMGLNHYLKYYAKTHVSWSLREPVELPDLLPPVDAPVRREALVKDRFFLNYCTYGYTMPWWNWEMWERFIDWMALNGINMPLAITGQEAVWYEVWREFGLTDAEVRNYFSGPAHLPWHRMANLDGFGGPLPMSWLTGQKELQKKIVQRERELNMTPVLPAFAGHVPAQIAQKFPQADIQQLSAWCGFEPTFFLNSNDSLFSVIQRMFMTKMTEMFGTDHIYGVDPFNEMDPPSWEPEYLADVSKHIYSSLRDVDPQARWLQMTWVFYYKRKSWTPERLHAYLTAVPADRLVLLDYFCEKTEVWRTTESFYGQPFVWCYLGNFGGNTMLVGDIVALDRKLDTALREAGPNMTGIGSTLESFDVSPQIFEFLFERVWNPHLDINVWTEMWADKRSGLADDALSRTAWHSLVQKIYHDWSFYGLGTQLVARPSLEGHGTYYTKPYYSYDNKDLRIATAALLNAAQQAKNKGIKLRDSQRYDLVNFASQYLGNCFMDIRNDFTQAYKRGDVPEMRRQVDLANQLFNDVDALLSTHPSFMLGPWVSDARALGSTPEEADYYERQAKTLLTIWGGPVLNDYANRMWGGLVKDYYAERWNRFFSAVIKAAEKGVDFDEKAFGEELSNFENAWPDIRKSYPTEPTGNTLETVEKILRRY